MFALSSPTTEKEENFEISIERWNNKINKRINQQNRIEFNNFQTKHLENLLENQNQILRNLNVKIFIKTYPESLKLIENIINQTNLLKNEQILKLILDSIFLILIPWKSQDDEEFEKNSYEWCLSQLENIISIPNSHNQISFRIIPLKKKKKNFFLKISEILISKQFELKDLEKNENHLSKDFLKIIFEDSNFNELNLQIQLKLLNLNFKNFFFFFEKIVLNKLQNRFSFKLKNEYKILFKNLFKNSIYIWNFIWNYLINLYFF